MANIGDVTARLRADVSDYVSGMQRAQQANQQLTSTVNQGSQAFRLSEQGVNQAVAAYDRAMAATGATASKIQELRADVDRATVAFRSGDLSAKGYAQTLQAIRNAALGLRAQGGVGVSDISTLNSILVKTAPAAETAVSGLSRVAMAAGLLASQASGTGFIVGRLAAAIGLTAASAPVVIGVLAGVAALVLGYKALTKDADAAAEATKKLETALSQQARASQGPAVTRGQNLGALAAEHQAAIQNLHDAQVMAQHERAAGPLGDQVADAEQRVTDALVARHNAMVPLIDKGQEEINSLKEQGFALTHTADQVILYKDALEGVPPRLAALAAAQERANTSLRLGLELAQIQRDIAAEMKGTGVLPSLAQQLAAIPPPSVDLTVNPWVAWRQNLEALRSPLDDVLDRANALKAFQDTVAKEQHPGGIVGPGEAADLQSLGLDPAEIQRELDKAGAPLDKATGDIKDRFRQQMQTVGLAGIHSLVQGMIDGTSSFMPLLQKAVLNFITQGITDIIAGLLGGDWGIASAGTVASGNTIGGGPGNTHGKAIRMNINVGPSRDPMSLARDGQWQQALRESLLVARSQGFK